MFIRGENGEHLELQVFRKFKQLPFGVTAAATVVGPYDPATDNWIIMKEIINPGKAEATVTELTVLQNQLKYAGIRKSTGKRVGWNRGAFGATYIYDKIVEIIKLLTIKTGNRGK